MNYQKLNKRADIAALLFPICIFAIVASGFSPSGTVNGIFVAVAAVISIIAFCVKRKVFRQAKDDNWVCQIVGMLVTVVSVTCFLYCYSAIYT